MVQESRRTNRAERNYGYVYGSAAPKVDIRHEVEDEKRKVHRVSRETRKNRKKLHSMSPAYAAVFLVCLCLTMGVIMWYVNLQSLVVSKVTDINRMESELNNLRQANDEEKLRIDNSIDLEEIKRIAIGELGMTYPEEGQIISYTSVGTDYMRKVVED